MQNEVNMLRAHSGDNDVEMRQFTDGLTSQLQTLQVNLTSFEGLKRNIENKFGLAHSLSVDDFAEKIYLMLGDNMAMMEELMLKDSQLEEFRERMEQNQKAVEQLSGFRQGYEENLKIMTSVQEN